MMDYAKKSMLMPASDEMKKTVVMDRNDNIHYEQPNSKQHSSLLLTNVKSTNI